MSKCPTGKWMQIFWADFFATEGKWKSFWCRGLFRKWPPIEYWSGNFCSRPTFWANSDSYLLSSVWICDLSFNLCGISGSEEDSTNLGNTTSFTFFHIHSSLEPEHGVFLERITSKNTPKLFCSIWGVWISANWKPWPTFAIKKHSLLQQNTSAKLW